MRSSRIVVVTNGNYFARRILDKLLGARRADVAAIVLVTGDYSGRTGFDSLRRVSDVEAPAYVAYKLIQFAALRSAAHAFPWAALDVRSLARRGDLPVLASRKINCPDVTRFVESFDPDVLASVSCPQRITAPLLGLARIAAINVHSSLLPEYAGLAPYFWVLSKGERRTGVSVHYMTERFDEGPILTQRTLEIPPGVSAFRLFAALADAGSDALVEAIDAALDDEKGRPQDASRRSYYSHPTPESCRELHRRGHRLVRFGDLVWAIGRELRGASMR